MNKDRGMSVAQAKSLARDPQTQPGVFSRLANLYPETWDDLLANPAVYSDLKVWIEQAKQASVSASSTSFDTQSKPSSSRPTKPTKKTREAKVKKIKTRGRRKIGKFLRGVGLLIVPSVAIYGLWLGIQHLSENQPPRGLVAMETLESVIGSPAWKYDLRTSGESSCLIVEFATMDQNQAIVLSQNDLQQSKCREATEPIPSTLTLIDFETGQSIWKIDLGAELDWTEKWQKQLVEIPGLNEVLVKFTDVNGRDAAGDSKSIDKDENRKMKTLVPYNRLNGLITDPVIAKSKYQPIMQAPVLEVLPIPGNLRSVLVMTNGSKKDFRYAKYRSKRLSSARWSVESDLKPMGGTPVFGNRLVLGREKDDEPKSILLGSGRIVSWAGSSAVKIYKIGSQLIQVAGDGVSEKATNIVSQGGPDGHKITINGLDSIGNSLWELKSRGYAISRDDSATSPANRMWYSDLFILSGKNNRFLSRVNVSDGSIFWKTKVSKDRFEVSRVSSTNAISLYLFEKNKLEAKLFSLVNLDDGQEFEASKISGKAVRVDGATTLSSILVNEPSRDKIIKNIESGKRASLGSGKDKSDKLRSCAISANNTTGLEMWKFECNGNQHVTRVAGRWIVLDLTENGQEFWLLGVGN